MHFAVYFVTISHNFSFKTILDKYTLILLFSLLNLFLHITILHILQIPLTIFLQAFNLHTLSGNTPRPRSHRPLLCPLNGAIILTVHIRRASFLMYYLVSLIKTDIFVNFSLHGCLDGLPIHVRIYQLAEIFFSETRLMIDIRMEQFML